MNAFDRSILSFINQFAHRSPTFDQFVVLPQYQQLPQGKRGVCGLVVAMVPGWRHRRKRESLVAGVVAGFVGLAVARVLALTVVRPRPLNVPELMTRIP
jgi:hypothetical protein